MAAELLVLLTPLIAKAVNNYLSAEVPEQVNKRIQLEVQQFVTLKVGQVLEGIEKTKLQYVSLAILSLVLTASQFFTENKSYETVVFFMLYAIPLYMSVRSLKNSYDVLMGVLRMEENIKGVIESALRDVGTVKKMLVKTFDRRSIDDLAKFAAGTIVFEMINVTSTKKAEIAKSILSYLVSFLNILLIRYYL